MKLLIITSVKEYQKDIATLLDKAGIAVFSVTETTGFKNHQNNPLLNDWFSHGDAQFDSLFIFSFAPTDQTERAIALIKQFNQQQASGFPVHTFVMAVESWNP